MSKSAAIHLGFVRSFKPDPQMDWSKANLDSNLFSYDDPVVEGEFKRFAYRDLASLFTCAGWIGGCVLYPIIASGQFPVEYAVLDFCAAGLLQATLVADASLLFVGEWTAQKAAWRSYISVLFGTGILMGTTVNLVSYYGRCADGFYFTIDALNMHPNAVNARHDCVDIVDPFTIVMHSVALMAITMHPMIKTGLALVGLGGRYLGYLGPGPTIRDQGESTGDLLLKLPIYALGMILLVGCSWLNFFRTRRQFAAALDNTARQVATKKMSDEVDGLLIAMVPVTALARLMVGETVTDWTVSATVLFSDMVGFTAWSSTRSCRTVVTMLNTICVELDHAASAQKIEKVKTIGDAYWAVCGLPDEVPDHAERMCHFGVAMHRTVKAASSRNLEWGAIQIRVGICSGPLSGAIFGTARVSYEVFGPTSELAEACEKNGVPDRTCISPSTAALLRPSVRLDPHTQLTIEGTVIQLQLLAAAGEAALLGHHRPTGPGTGTGSDPAQSVPSTPRSQTPSDNAGAMKVSTKQAERHRREFIERQAAKQSELAEANAVSESPEELEERLSARKVNWVLMQFADAELEAQYVEFALVQQRRVSIFVRLVVVVLVLLQFGLLFGQRAQTNALSLTLLSLALVGSLVTCGGLFVGLPPLADVVVLHLTMLLDMVGVGTLKDSIVGNDPTYVFVLFLAVLGVGAPQLPSVAILVLNATFSVAPLLYFVWSSVVFFSDFMFVSLSQLLITAVAVIIEKILRRQFVEHVMQTYYINVQRKRHTEQRALLRALVPQHVVDPLQEWMRADMDPATSVAMEFTDTCVGFIKLLPVAGHVPPLATTAAAVGIPGRAESDSQHWLLRSHAQVDQILSRFSSFDKLKTIGDVVMVAGPFSAQYAVKDSAADALRAIAEMHRSSLPVLAGLHMGDVTGAVLGTSRLCFDIFGDCVNTASRVFSTLPRGYMLGVSDDFFMALGDTTSTAFDLSQCVEVFAKGKGALKVRHAQAPSQA